MTAVDSMDLFGDVPAQDLQSTRLQISGQSRQGKLSPEQRAFNRLTKHVSQARNELAGWGATTERLLIHVQNVHAPVRSQLEQAQRQLVGVIDQMLQHSRPGLRLGKRQRAALVDLLLEVVQALLAARGDDSELEALHDRYSDQSHQELQAENRQFEMHMTEEMLSEIFGDEVIDGHGASNPEELLREAQRRIEERFRAEEVAQEAHRGRAKARKKNAGKPDKKSIKEDAEKAASQSVRDIYRKLARAIHPDRESDPKERVRKTELMQRINVAYSNNDLLTLLACQSELEHLGDAAVDQLPDEKIKHYNHVLKEQLQAIKDEIRASIDALAIRLQIDPMLRPAREKEFEAILAGKLRELNGIYATVIDTISALLDPARCKDEIKSIVHEMSSPENLSVDEMDEIALLMMGMRR